MRVSYEYRHRAGGVRHHVVDDRPGPGQDACGDLTNRIGSRFGWDTAQALLNDVILFGDGLAVP